MTLFLSEHHILIEAAIKKKNVSWFLTSNTNAHVKAESSSAQGQHWHKLVCLENCCKSHILWHIHTYLSHQKVSTEPWRRNFHHQAILKINWLKYPGMLFTTGISHFPERKTHMVRRSSLGRRYGSMVYFCTVVPPPPDIITLLMTKWHIPMCCREQWKSASCISGPDCHTLPGLLCD